MSVMSRQPAAIPLGRRGAGHWLSFPPFMVRLFSGVYDVLLLPVAVAAIGGYFGASGWLLDMANFFRPHIAGLALLLVALALISQQPLRLGLALLLFGIAAYPLLGAAPSPAKAATFGNTSANWIEPNIQKTVMMPSAKPKSPTRLTTKALIEAALALGFLNQKPISR